MGILDSLWSVFAGEKGETDDGLDDWNPQEDRPGRAREEAELVVTGTMEIGGIGTVVTARITDGVVRTEDEIRFENGETAKVETIELHHNEVESAEEGNVVGLELAGIDASHLSEGDMAATETG